jgi:hypothetical protein
MKKLLLFLFLMTISLGQSQNLITNGNFENGTTGWVFGSPGAVSGGEAFYSSSNSGGDPWSTELKQVGKSFTAGVSYTLSFRARALANRNMSVNIQNTNIWNDQFRTTVALTTTMTTYTFVFVATSTNGNAQLNFHMAAQGSSAGVYIDDVSIMPPAPAPTLSNFSVPAKLVGDAAFELTAPTTNSTGAFTYTSSNTSVASISGSTVTIVGVGTSTITASQAADGSFGAGSITASFIVTAAPLPTVGALSLPNALLGDAPFVLTAPTSNSSGAFTYTSSNTSVATISGSTLTFVGFGTSTITATQAATESYDSRSVTATLTVGEPKILLLGFETGVSGGATTQFGGMAAPAVVTGTGANTSNVLQITTNTGGDIWQGSNITLSRPVKLTTTKTMTIDVLSSEPIAFLMKVNGGVAGAPEAAAQVVHNGDGTWQTLSFTFNTSLDGKAAMANGVYYNMVIHPYWVAGATGFGGSKPARTFYIDNIKGPVALVAPTLSNFSISAKTVGNTFELTAPTTNSDGAFTYTSSDNAIATVNGTIVTVVGPGNVTITATQAAGTYNTSGTITATFTASSLAIPTIGALTVPAKVVGDAAFDLSVPDSNSTGAFTYTSSNTAVATISGSTVTIVGVGTSTITAAQAATSSYEAGSVSATLTVTLPNAPTPTNDAADVISIFSGAYTDLAGTNFFPNWGQSTQYAQVNGMLKYSSLNYQGITFAPPINGSAMEKLHIDIWTPDCTSFQMFVLDGSDEQSVTLTPSFNGWNSYDISLSQYTLLTKSNIKEFKIVGSGTVYLDNIYFWKLPAGTNTYYADADGDGYGAGAASLSTATTAPAGYSVNNTDCNDTNAAVNPGATEVLNSIDDDCDGLIDEGLLPTIPQDDAPEAPARNAWDVQSVYSSAYTNYSNVNFFPNWGQTTTFSTYAPLDDEALKYSNLTFQGIDFNGSKNISAMTKLHIDVWTPNITSFKVVLIAGGENAVTLTPTQSGWNSYDIDLATQYAGRNLSAAIQLKLERTLWTPTDGNVNSLYLDNIYFYRPATTQPPTVGTFTVPAKVVGDAAFDLTAPTSNSTGAFTYTSSNAGVATISGSTVTIVGAGTSTITATQAAAGSYAAVSVIATLDVSLATAAPTPTVPGDRVLSIFSGAPGYSDVAGTQWRPNWGQATQYDLVNVVGNPTIKYSNLNYEGVQLASPVDVSSYTTLHIDVYGAGTSAVDFYVINQAGGAGSPLQQIEVNTPLTLQPGVWNSFDIELSSLTGLELDRVGQFKFVGSGTIYLDNIYFSKPTPSHTSAPTVANVTYCKGATASNLTATAIGTNLLKWYSTATIATALTTAPKPVTTTVGTKDYYVAQVMSDAFVSPRAKITVTVLALPTEVPGVITATTETATPGTYAASIKAVGPYVNTTTTVSYRVPAFTAGLTYYWTVPAGVSIVGQAAGVTSVTQEGVNANILNVNFKNISSGVGAIGSITVQAKNENGCLSAAKSLVALAKALPAAPAAIKMTDASMALPLSGIPTAVTSFAKYMGRTTELTLTATVAPTATSYIWELPTGVNITQGSATTVDGVTSSTSNIITVNFSGVTKENTHNYSTTALVSTNVVRIGVKSVNGVGISTTANTTLANSSLDFYPNTTSTAKLLTLTAIAPATPGTITASTANVCSVVGTDSNVTYTVAPVLNAYANGYTWTVPTGASIVGSATGNSIAVSYSSSYAAAGAVTVTSSNGVATSAAKSLLIARAAPAAIASISGGTTYSTCNQTFSTVSVANQTYTWTVPTGATIVSGQDTNSVVVNYGSLIGKQTIKVVATNGCGLSGAVKSVTLTSGSCPTNITSRNASVAKDFSVIAYPNPSSEVFTLDVQSSSKGATGVQVYDMVGRLIENRQVDSNSIEIGRNYQSGVYNVIVTQDSNVKTLRLIKR